MENSITIRKVEQDGDDGVLITFSDGTVAGYVVEELLHLRPYRESTQAHDDARKQSIDRHVQEWLDQSI